MFHGFKYMVIDAVSIALTYIFAVIIFRVLQIPITLEYLPIAIPAVIVFKLLIFLIFGFYNILTNHVGFEDVMKFALVSAGTNIALVIFIALTNIMFMFKSAYVFIIPTEIFLLVVPRVVNRIWNFIRTNINWTNALGRKTLIIGAGSAGELVIKEIYRNKDLNNLPVAFVDDDPDKIGRRLSGIRIIGPISDINRFIDANDIEEVVIAINDYPKAKLQVLIDKISQKNTRIKKLMSISDVDSGQTNKIIEVKIEDLLNREEVQLDNEGIADFIKDEVVLITGGGGSIGSELCRQIVELKPKQLIIFDIYENNAYDIQQEILRKFYKRGMTINLEVLIGSVYNEKRMEYIFSTYKPTIVFHAAAYKHVPLMENSPVEAVRTNVIGTYYAASMACKYGVKKFVLVSSDKAVRPTNIMGATKRYAELIIQQHQLLDCKTKFSAVRFGNVLGSNGSVIPLFKKQIEDGGPVTVTHPEITRYFMTIPESVGLILQCAVYAEGGEVFVLDMGIPVKIKDLAEKMIRLAGYRPYKDINIEFTGLRPGEKMFEELLVDEDLSDHRSTPNSKIFIETDDVIDEPIINLSDLKVRMEMLQTEDIKSLIASIIKTYQCNGEVRDS